MSYRDSYGFLTKMGCKRKKKKKSNIKEKEKRKGTRGRLTTAQPKNSLLNNKIYLIINTVEHCGTFLFM